MALDYTVEIEKFYREFPEMLGKVFIVNPDKHKNMNDFLEANPDFIQLQQAYQNTQIIREKGVEIGDYQRFAWAIFNKKHAENNLIMGGTYNAIIDIADMVDILHGKKDPDGLKFISFVIPRKETGFLFNKRFLNNLELSDFADDIDHKIVQKYILYHELGHAIYEQNNKEKLAKYFANGYNPKAQFQYETETAAETYAMIRLIQEYGLENNTVELIMTNRYLDRINSPSSIYNFIPAVEEVVNLAKNGELENLSPKDVAKLADNITTRKVITTEQAKEIDSKLWRIYSAIYQGRDLADFEINSVSNIEEPVVLKDIQYVLNCLEQTTASNQEIQKRVKKAWGALEKNPLIKSGEVRLKQIWQAKTVRLKQKNNVKTLKTNNITKRPRL